MNFENCIDLLREFETEESIVAFDMIVEAFRENPKLVFCAGLEALGGKDYERGVLKGMFYGVMLAAISNNPAIIDAIQAVQGNKQKQAKD